MIFHRIATPGGTAVVASRGGVVAASSLPDGDGEDAVRRLRGRFPGAREAGEGAVAGARALRLYLEGDPGALEGVAVDLSGLPPFAARVYAALRAVGPGVTVSYGELARRAGSPGGARAVGGALRRNPLAPFVPCHRVVGASGALVGFSARGGLGLKAALLAAEARANP